MRANPLCECWEIIENFQSRLDEVGFPKHYPNGTNKKAAVG